MLSMIVFRSKNNSKILGLQRILGLNFLTKEEQKMIATIHCRDLRYLVFKKKLENRNQLDKDN